MVAVNGVAAFEPQHLEKGHIGFHIVDDSTSRSVLPMAR
jgi:hypothetical protein